MKTKNSVRIIPMSLENEEFVGKTVEQVQNEFFLETLPIKESGWYYYDKSGLNSVQGDLLLFQMDNSIIASAIYKDTISFDKRANAENGGVISVYTDSIKIFKPITKEELKTYIKSFNGFTQTKQIFDIDKVNIKDLFIRFMLK